MAFTLDKIDILGLTLFSKRNQEEDYMLNVISNRKPVQNINYQGGNTRVERETGNESDCRVQDRLERGQACFSEASTK